MQPTQKNTENALSRITDNYESFNSDGYLSDPTKTVVSKQFQKRRIPRTIAKRGAILRALEAVNRAVSHKNRINFGLETSEVLSSSSSTSRGYLLTTSETAATLGISAKTLANWRVSGTHNLPFIKVGSRIRYRSDDVRRFLINHSKQSTSER